MSLSPSKTMEATFFRDLAYVFGAAVVGGGVAKALRQPLILGYVLGGFLIGPFTPGPTLSEVHQFEVLAEIGVILLMYSIGLEFSFGELLEVKWVAIFGGPLSILLSLGLGTGTGWLMGWGTTQRVAVGAIALMVGLGLTQIGEFSYVLVRVARDAHLVTDDIYHATLAASVITILLNGLLMKALPRTKTTAPAG
jgi:predicted Kef-type K+ transport protein